jgi:tellurite resistance protein
MNQHVPREAGIPSSMALAWGLTTPASRGPKRALSLESVVAACMAVAVADGWRGCR